MTLSHAAAACARIVEQGDPDRFRTVMAAPVVAREVLFPLYAFNVEVARAPWVTKEAMIAEMRLQWWRDALEEIATGAEVRKHEVTTPLSGLLTPAQARRLDANVAARRWDIYRDPFEDAAHFDHYLDHTAGALMWTAAACLGASEADEVAILAVARAAGLVAFFRAIPALEDAGRVPLLDGTRDGVVALAARYLSDVSLPRLPKAARAALWPAIGARRVLGQIMKDPGMVADGRVPVGSTPWRLSVTALTGQMQL